MTRTRLLIQIFPIIQLALIVTGWYMISVSILLSLIVFLIAALFLNFSLHITVHHFIHFGYRNEFLKMLVELLYTILLGFPTNLYRLQHYNHHRHNNKIGDVTSTWKKSGQQIVAKNRFLYSFFWFVQKPNPYFISEAKEKGDLSKIHQIKILVEILSILGVYLFFFLYSPLFALHYLGHVYLGWCFIALTNYGQHLPITYDTPIAYTYKSKWYNRLFFNNGLHFEHHFEPSKNYAALELKNENLIHQPHLFAGLSTNKIKK